MHDHNFRIAFGVRNFFSRESLDSEEYVRWHVRLTTKVSGGRVERDLSLHKCTEDDYKLFYPVSERYRYALEELKEKDVLHCYDVEEFKDLVIFGENNNDDT